MQGSRIDLSPGEERDLLRDVADRIAAYREDLSVLRCPVEGRGDLASLRRSIAECDFREPWGLTRVLEFVTSAMRDHQVHSSHPGYFGLFNPRPTAAGLAGDLLAAGFNPNLANWSNSPFGAEVERHLISELGRKLAMPPAIDGIFTSGASESNLTAVLCALEARFPGVSKRGLASLGKRPTLYCSAEAHHSLEKAARASGLGEVALRRIRVASSRMVTSALEEEIVRDLNCGNQPLLVAATVGSTATGGIDDLSRVAECAKRFGLWLHTDAAWAGAAALAPTFSRELHGLCESDSIAIDAHKWLATPIAAGVFLVAHRGVLEPVFETSPTYMPAGTVTADHLESFRRSLPWSRRFAALGLFMSLLAHGWEGLQDHIVKMVALGRLLRAELERAGWRIENETPLPLVCFGPIAVPGVDRRAMVEGIVRCVLEENAEWLSTAELDPQGAVLRVCITNATTSAEDVRRLVMSLNTARESVLAAIGPASR